VTYLSLLLAALAGSAMGGITLTPNPEPAPSATIAPIPSSDLDRSSLLKEYERAQATAISALVQKQRRSMEDLRAEQKQRRKEWLEKEKVARHHFLAQEHEGPKIRAYIRDYKSRLQALDKSYTDERTSRQKENESRFEAEKTDQKTRHKEFVDSLARGETPADHLWPGH
jgi:hypothetical protein